MAYSAICDQLHFHFDTGILTAKVVLLLPGIQHLDSATDQNESVIDRNIP